MSVGDSVRMLLGAVQVMLFGNPGYGAAAERVERYFAGRFEGKDAVAFPSARAGLASALRALGVGPDDEVLVTGYTCSAVAVAVLSAGAKPVYVDIDPRSFAMAPDRAKACVTARTRAIVVQHTYGIPSDVRRLCALAQTCGLAVIEDAALALGSAIGDRALGTFGHASVFSFELSKTVTAGWGGIVVTRSQELGGNLRAIREKGGRMKRIAAARRLFQVGASGLLYRPEMYRFTKYFIAGMFRLRLFRPSASAAESAGRLAPDAFEAPADLHWRIVERQLARLGHTLQRAAEIARRYIAVLVAFGWSPFEIGEAVRLCRFPVLVKDPAQWISFFGAHGFEIGRWFDAPVSPWPQDPRLLKFVDGSCPNAALLSRHVINFPVHSRLSDVDVDRFCDLLEQMLRSLPAERRFVAVEASTPVFCA